MPRMDPALQTLFQSPFVCYPGYCSDGQPVKYFNTRYLASSFVYVDYLVTEETLKEDLDSEPSGYHGRFHGYRRIERIDLSIHDLTPQSWRPSVPIPHDPWAAPRIRPYGFLDVLQREDGSDTSYGAEQLSILFLGADGHATYDALFCQPGCERTPYAVVLQDHGFGGNYSHFGRGGLMEQIAQRNRVFPERLLVASNTDPWDGYEPIPGTSEQVGDGQRQLYQRVE